MDEVMVLRRKEETITFIMMMEEKVERRSNYLMWTGMKRE